MCMTSHASSMRSSSGHMLQCLPRHAKCITCCSAHQGMLDVPLHACLQSHCGCWHLSSPGIIHAQGTCHPGIIHAIQASYMPSRHHTCPRYNIIQASYMPKVQHVSPEALKWVGVCVSACLHVCASMCVSMCGCGCVSQRPATDLSVTDLGGACGRQGPLHLKRTDLLGKLLLRHGNSQLCRNEKRKEENKATQTAMRSSLPLKSTQPPSYAIKPAPQKHTAAQPA